MGKWLARFNKLAPTVDHLQLKLKYNQLLKREKKGETWMDDPVRTEAELTKGMKLLNQIVGELSHIIDLLGPRNTTESERTNGFDILPLLGMEVSLDELPKEWG